MILAVTDLQDKLIAEVCCECGYEDVQIMTGVKSINKFFIQELRNLNNFDTLILDVSSTNETEEEILKTVVTIKSMYNIRIVILAINYNAGKSSLLSRLFLEGIYDFVTSTNYDEQKRELHRCVNGENQYKDAVKYRYDTIQNTNKEKVIITKEYKKLRQNVTIGIAGTTENIGVTTQALLITSFFNNIGIKACYMCANKSKDIEEMQEMLDISSSKEENMITYNGVDLYKNSIDAISLGYDIYVYDFGLFNEEILDNYITKDVKIIVSGSKVWEFSSLFSIFEKLEKLNDINFLINFTEEQEKSNFIQNMYKYKKNTYFTEYSPNPFSTNINIEIYHKIFKDFIAERGNKVTIVEKPKKSFLNVFLKRGSIFNEKKSI